MGKVKVDNSNSDWYKKAKQNLISQKKVIYDTSDREMPNRYHRYYEVTIEIEKLERWKRACATSSSWT